MDSRLAPGRIRMTGADQQRTLAHRMPTPACNWGLAFKLSLIICLARKHAGPQRRGLHGVIQTPLNKRRCNSVQRNILFGGRSVDSDKDAGTASEDA